MSRRMPEVGLWVVLACAISSATVMRAQDQPDEVYRPGNGISSPVPVRQVKPQYTQAAKDAHIEGTVLLECVFVPTAPSATRRS